MLGVGDFAEGVTGQASEAKKILLWPEGQVPERDYFRMQQEVTMAIQEAAACVVDPGMGELLEQRKFDIQRGVLPPQEVEDKISGKIRFLADQGKIPTGSLIRMELDKWLPQIGVRSSAR